MARAIPSPIPTRYKGYRFRSRLEARWAVFFDAIGLKWEYELEGLALPSRNYLPDFYLTDLGVWVEVKPTDADYDRELSREVVWVSKRPIVWLDGTPDRRHYRFVNVLDFFPPEQWDDDLPPIYEDWINIGYSARTRKVQIEEASILYLPPARTTQFMAAIDAARGARFEFGESGAR